AEGVGRAPEQDGARDRPPEQRDQRRGRDDHAREQQHGALVGGHGEVDVLTCLGLPVAAAQHVDGQQRGQQQEQQAQEDRHGVRAERVGGVARARRERHVGEHEQPGGEQQGGHSQLGAFAKPGAHATSPRLRRTPATRSFSDRRNAPNSSPGRNASCQPLRSSAAAHSGDPRSAVNAATSSARPSSSSPGGATMPRQLVNSTSTPTSWSVGASTPGTRCAAVTASTRSSPASIWSAYSDRPETPNATLPPSTAASSSPPPS